MLKVKKIFLAMLSSFLLIILLAFHSSAQVVPGDLNKDGVMNRLDAVYLLFHTFLAQDFPVEQNVDYNADGIVSDRDAFLLLSGNIGNSGDENEDDNTGTITPPGDDDVPSLGPVEIPTNYLAKSVPRSNLTQETLDLSFSSEVLYLNESVLVTIKLSDTPGFTSALVQINAGAGAKIQNAKWLIDADISQFQNGLGVIAFEQETSLSGNVVSFELLGIEEVLADEISVTFTYHDPECNDLGSVCANAPISVVMRPYLLGDVNHDGFVDTLDGQMLLRYLNGWEEHILYHQSMDVNEDGKVDSLDGLILLRYVNGWEIKLGK